MCLPVVAIVAKVSAKKKWGECRIVDKNRKFVVGQTGRQHANFSANVKSVCAALNKKEIAGKLAAKNSFKSSLRLRKGHV